MKNREFIKIVNMREANFYHFKKRYPKFVELAKLGAIIESIVKNDLNNKDNKK